MAAGSSSPATRSLTEVFILMRNNAMQSKHIFADSGRGNGQLYYGNEERMSLVPLNDNDDGSSGGAGGFPSASSHLSRIPPEWVSVVDEAQYELSRVRAKLGEVRELQNKHVLRPNFEDDASEEERAIKAGSEQVTQMLGHCQRLIQHVQRSGHANSPTVGSAAKHRHKSSRLLDNVVRALFAALQASMAEFRTLQTGYLKKLRTREDNYQQYFDMAFSADQPSFSTNGPTDMKEFSGMVNGNSGSFAEGDGNGTDAGDISAMERGEVPQMTMAQLTAIEQRSAVVEQREREIIDITKSILELNTMFKDLAGIVLDQGTVVDRIDYNIEQSSVRVKSALTQVKKAEKYQKKNRKMIIIIVLSVILAFLILVLIIFKSSR